MTDAFLMLGASFTLVLLLMSCLWGIYYFQRNAGIVDIGWRIGFILAAWSYFFLGVGDLMKMIAITTMVTIWAVRHLIQIFSRYTIEHEDPRYTSLRKRWGGDPEGLLFLMLFIFQGVLIVVLSLPFFIVDFGSYPEWSVIELIAILIWLVGVCGETLADTQLQVFQKDPENQGKVCQKGVWRFCRHPNYFFEFIVWVGFFLFALPSYGGTLAIVSPILMFFLLVKYSKDKDDKDENALKDKGQ